MGIEERDIEKGALSKILPRFYPNSISYLSELNEYRMYAEMWCNDKSQENQTEKQKNKEVQKRKDIRHAGYLKTLEMGAVEKKREIDRVRFDSFITANSVDYILNENNWHAYIQLGGIQNNSFFNEIIEKDEYLVEMQSLYPGSIFHTKESLPKTLDIDIEVLGLRQDKQGDKCYFEVPTDTQDITNQYQKQILMQVLGEDIFFEKLELLSKINRKYIRCLFEDPEDIDETGISRLCVALPFYETIVVDFAGTLEGYKSTCTLGTLIREDEGQLEEMTTETSSESTKETEGPQIDTDA